MHALCPTMHAVIKQPGRRARDKRMLVRAWGGRRPRAAGYFPEVGKVRLHHVLFTSICASRRPHALITEAATVVQCLTVCARAAQGVGALGSARLLPMRQRVLGLLLGVFGWGFARFLLGQLGRVAYLVVTFVDVVQYSGYVVMLSGFGRASARSPGADRMVRRSRTCGLPAAHVPHGLLHAIHREQRSLFTLQLGSLQAAKQLTQGYKQCVEGLNLKPQLVGLRSFTRRQDFAKQSLLKA